MAKCETKLHRATDYYYYAGTNLSLSVFATEFRLLKHLLSFFSFIYECWERWRLGNPP